MEKRGSDPTEDTLGRRILRHQSASLVEAMTIFLNENKLLAAQRVGAESVETVKTKAHQH